MYSEYADSLSVGEPFSRRLDCPVGPVKCRMLSFIWDVWCGLGVSGLRELYSEPSSDALNGQFMHVVMISLHVWGP